MLLATLVVPAVRAQEAADAAAVSSEADAPADGLADAPSEARASDAPATVDPELLTRRVRDHWELRIVGQKVGWLRHEQGPAEHDGAPALLWREVKAERYAVKGRVYEHTTTQEMLFDAEPPHALVRARHELETPWVTETVTVTFEGDEARAVITGRGPDRARVLPSTDVVFGDVVAPLAWVRDAPRAEGDRLEVRLYVAAAMRELSTALVVDAVREAEDGGPLHELLVESDSMDEVRLLVDAEGRLVGGSDGDKEMVPAPEETACVLDGELPELDRFTQWRLAKRIGETKSISELVLTSRDERARRIEDGPFQRVHVDEATGVTTVWLGPAHGAFEPVTEEARAAALAETPSHPIEDPRIKKLARRAVGRAPESSPRLRYESMIRFVDAFLEDVLLPNPRDMDEILTKRRGDCTEHAKLFVTLARSLGLPAREVAGYVHGGDLPPELAGHEWVEVELDGHWVPMDPSWNEVQINATHLRTGLADPTNDRIPLSAGVTFDVRRVGRGDKVWTDPRWTAPEP